MSSGYRDELQALRAQLDATRTELAETRDDLERTRKARDEAEQRLAEALSPTRADTDDSAVARAPAPPARRSLPLALLFGLLVIVLFVTLSALRACPPGPATPEQRRIIERGMQEEQLRR